MFGNTHNLESNLNYTRNEKVIWPNGLEVVYNGSGFFVLNGYE